tara:strand:- start:2127 stop:2723 length:597 start_codon:yes stop_codon:yes gene_type:complete
MERRSDEANKRCAVENCYNTMILTETEINEKYAEWLNINKTEHHQIFMNDYKDYIMITGKHFTGNNLAKYRKWWVARYIIETRPRELDVVANYITNKWTSYQCPSCWTKYNIDGSRHKNSIQGTHYHGSRPVGVQGLENYVDNKVNHCMYDHRPVNLHVTNETVRITADTPLNHCMYDRRPVKTAETPVSPPTTSGIV